MGIACTISELKKYVQDCFGKGEDKRFLSIVEDFSNFVLHEIQNNGAQCINLRVEMGL